MNLSIIIPDHNDLKIIQLIDSIDFTCSEVQHVELVIVLNKPTEELARAIDKLQKSHAGKFEFTVVTIDICNFGHIYNIGIKNCRYDLIMFLDSDLVCRPGAIKKLIEAMNDKTIHIAKGKVFFDKKSTLGGKVVYESRYATTTNVKVPYIPVIVMRNDIFHILDDGYMFPEDTVWCADADFANRVMKKGLKVAYLDADFYHPCIGIKKDLKDAIYYGFGKGIRVKRTKEEWKPLKEIRFINQLGLNENIHFSSKLYLLLWCCIHQISCGLQTLVPNTMFFKQSIAFKSIEEQQAERKE